MNKKEKSIGRWISILYRYGHSYLAKELRPYNIGSGQHIFLLALFEKDGISQDTLANNLNINKGTTARAIKKLEAEGYVVRKIDPKDKRVNKVFITEKAEEIKPILYKVLSKWTDILSTNFIEEEKEITIKLLNKMSQNAEAFMKERH